MIHKQNFSEVVFTHKAPRQVFGEIKLSKKEEKSYKIKWDKRNLNSGVISNEEKPPLYRIKCGSKRK